MARRRLPRALYSSVSAFALDPSEIVYDQTSNALRYGDGTTPGGNVVGKGVISEGEVVPPFSLPYGNPSLDGGLEAPADTLSKSATSKTMSLSGTRTKAQIAHAIHIDDNQVGPESSASNPTPQSASYGLSITGSRPNWYSSSLTGEMGGVSVLLRQARSDTAAYYGNVGVQFGFACFSESLTFTADSSGAPEKGVNVQVGVANSRENAYYGIVVQSVYGSLLPGAAIRIASSAGTSWARYLEIVDAAGTEVLYIRGADGTLFTKTVAPLVQYAGNLGAPSLEYDAAYLRSVNLVPRNFASLPSAASAVGMIARIYDAASAITSFNQAVTAGGGANTALVTSDGTNWRALSS